MYNANYPSENELPTTKQLLVSTLIAFITAAVILLTTILPAEYGIDPTGIGKRLNLTQMGEIKVQLAEEAKEEAKEETGKEVKLELGASEKAAPEPVAEVKPVVQVQAQQVNTVPEESITVTLSPGEAAEVKVAMDQSATVSYFWNVNKGHVNFDTHGDNSGIKYHNYNKGKAVTEDKGEIVAAFDGKHGWFWRNRSSETVTVSLTVTGEFTDMVRVL